MICFLVCGQLACADSESGSSAPFLTGSDSSAVTEADAAPVKEAGTVARADSGSLHADTAGAGTPRGPDLDDGGAAEPVGEAQPGTFSHIYENAFRTCRTQCHVMGFSMLNMATREAAYAALVDQDSNPRNMDCAPLDLKRVKPGAPEESLLYLKLDINAPCGQQMPPGGLLPLEYRDEVRAWIANGAKND
jgi:hypothetical protein